MIEHLFVQILPVPRPRAVPSANDRKMEREAAAALRREEREKSEEADKAKRAMKWAAFKGKGGDGDGDQGTEETKSGDNDGKKDGTAATGTSYKFGKGEGEEGVDWYGSEEGFKAAEALTDEPCLWDADLNYELQVELALTIRRLVEQFAAACLSIQHSRSFDAVCTIVPGVATAIMDSLLRRLATDQPSEFTAILMGCTVEGRHLGMSGFGVSVGSFAEQVRR